HEASPLWLVGKESQPEELWGTPDPALQKAIEHAVAQSEAFSRIDEEAHLSMALVDITDPAEIRYAFIRPDWETFTASLSKIAVLLGVVNKVKAGGDP